MKIYVLYQLEPPVDKFIKIVQWIGFVRIKLRFFDMFSCKIYMEYGYYKANTEAKLCWFAYRVD